MSGITIREARIDDLEAIIRLHEADDVGGHGDAWTPENRRAYEDAFAAVQRSPDNTLFVAVEGGAVIGTFQLILIPSLTGRGALRAKLASVQVRADRRSLGIGARMVAFAEEAAWARGAKALELTSAKPRADAHRFYERLGYARSHEGFKKVLGS
jgi:GNAT superfamily N-acetyltransferase